MYLVGNFWVCLFQMKDGVALPAGFPPHHWQHCSHLTVNKVFLPDFPSHQRLPPTKNNLPPKIASHQNHLLISRNKILLVWSITHLKPTIVTYSCLEISWDGMEMEWMRWKLKWNGWDEMEWNGNGLDEKDESKFSFGWFPPSFREKCFHRALVRGVGAILERFEPSSVQ